MHRGCLITSKKNVVAWNTMLGGLKNMQVSDHLNLDQLRLKGELLFVMF
jgi:hypothetical protein